MALVNPHGGAALRPLALAGEAAATEMARAQKLPKLTVSSREKGDLIMLGIGGFTPLEGFMTHADWQGVCDGMRTASGLFWPIPITLSATRDEAEAIAVGGEVALMDPDDGSLLATMLVTEKYAIDKAHECASVFRTADAEHPGVQMVMAQGEVNLAGPVKVLSDGGFKAKYGALFMTPAETRAEFARLGWSKVAAFQTRNPMHRSHEYLAKVAIEVCDGVLIHSLLGNLKPGDIPADVRTRAISVLTEKYFVGKSVVQAGYPLDMRYAGPREALLHALFRQNYGCSHQIVGRDHAGVGSYYGPFDAHHIFDEIPRGRAGDRGAQDRLDILVLPLRGNGLCPNLPARRRRQAAGVGNQASQVALRGGRGARGIQPPRSARDPACVLRGAHGKGGSEARGPFGALSPIDKRRLVADAPHPDRPRRLPENFEPLARDAVFQAVQRAVALRDALARRQVEGPLVLGAGELASFEGEFRDVRDLVRAAAVVDPDVPGCAQDEKPAVSHLESAHAVGRKFGECGDVVPFGRGLRAQSRGVEAGNVHLEDDVDRPDDPGEPQRREGHEERVEDLVGRRTFAKRPAEVLLEAVARLRVDLGDDRDQVARLGVEVASRFLEEGEIGPDGVGADLDEIAEGVAHFRVCSRGGEFRVRRSRRSLIAS